MVPESARWRAGVVVRGQVGYLAACLAVKRRTIPEKVVVPSYAVSCGCRRDEFGMRVQLHHSSPGLGDSCGVRVAIVQIIRLVEPHPVGCVDIGRGLMLHRRQAPVPASNHW